MVDKLLEHPEYAVQIAFCAIVWYFVRTSIPAAIKLTIDSMSDQRELDRAERRQDREDTAADIERITSSYDKIADRVQRLSENIVRLLEATRRRYDDVPVDEQFTGGSQSGPGRANGSGMVGREPAELDKPGRHAGSHSTAERA